MLDNNIVFIKLDVFLGKRPPENKWFPYEDWRGKEWNEIGEYEITDFDKKYNLIKVRRVK